MSSCTHSEKSDRRKRRDSGHLLLAILLVMALMIIAATYEAPRIIQQLKRDREAEMIHRGTEYARAIKKFYKKFGRYPTSIEQLENTNNIRFLRKRYKDPLTKDGKWTLLHYTDVAATLAQAGPGTPAAALGTQGQQRPGSPFGQQSSAPFGSSTSGSAGSATSGGFGASSFGGGNTQSGANAQGTVFSQQQGLSGDGQQQGSPGSTFGSSSGQTTTGDSSSSGGGGSTFGSSSATPGGGTSNPNTPSTTLGSGQSLGAQTFGAGAIIGVGSKSKDPTIRIYNKKKAYDEWQFIYNPVMDQANVLLKGPYSPSAFVGSSNIGTNPGLPQGGFGSVQPGSTNNLPGGSNPGVTPGVQQFPPDQNH